MSSPTPSTSSLPRMTPRIVHRSTSSPSRPLSARYARTQPASSISARRPRAISAGTSSPTSDVFGDGATPTQNAMWRDRLARRMAERERRKRARDNDLARRRGMSDPGYDYDEDEDEDEAERQAQADDEELFRHLMVLQRRRDQHAALRAYEAAGGESLEFWESELDSLAREEQAICARLGDLTGLEGLDIIEENVEERWEREAAEAEEAERVSEAQMGEDDDMAIELGPEDWAALAAMEAQMDEPMEVE